MKFQCPPRLSQSRCYSQPFHLSTGASVNIANIVGINLSVLKSVIPHVVGANLKLTVPLSTLSIVALKTLFLARSQSKCNDGNNKKSFHGFGFICFCVVSVLVAVSACAKLSIVAACLSSCDVKTLMSASFCLLS